MTPPRGPPDLSWTEPQPLRTAAVVYDSTFGHTRAVAEALARGLRNEGVKTSVLSVAEALGTPIDNFDLVAVGSPAHQLRSTKEIHRLLQGLHRMARLKGHYGYAFETRLSHHPGGAARQIASAMSGAGLAVPRQPDSAVIERTVGPGAAEQFDLQAGSESGFEAIGAELVKLIRGEVAPV